jgi:hypothetical protein
VPYYQKAVNNAVEIRSKLPSCDPGFWWVTKFTFGKALTLWFVFQHQHSSHTREFSLWNQGNILLVLCSTFCHLSSSVLIFNISFWIRLPTLTIGCLKSCGTQWQIYWHYQWRIKLAYHGK